LLISSWAMIELRVGTGRVAEIEGHLYPAEFP
jgi:hypothetical protein